MSSKSLVLVVSLFSSYRAPRLTSTDKFSFDRLACVSANSSSRLLSFSAFLSLSRRARTISLLCPPVSSLLSLIYSNKVVPVPGDEVTLRDEVCARKLDQLARLKTWLFPSTCSQLYGSVRNSQFNTSLALRSATFINESFLRRL